MTRPTDAAKEPKPRTIAHIDGLFEPTDAAARLREEIEQLQVFVGFLVTDTLTDNEICSDRKDEILNRLRTIKQLASAAAEREPGTDLSRQEFEL